MRNKTTLFVIILPLFLMVLNFIIKGIFLNANSIAGDEPFSIYYAQMNVLDIIRLLSSGNNPPFYEIILHFWIKLFGISAFSVRSLSLIFSSITVLYIYKIGTKFFNNRIAIYSSLFFIFSNYHTIFAHEARVYAFLGLLSIMSFYYFLKIIINNDTNKYTLFKFVSISILLIYSHYFGFFILFIQNSYVLFKKQLILKYGKISLFIGMIILLFYIPNIKSIIYRFLDSSMNGTWVKPVYNLGNFHDVFYLFLNNNTILYVLFISILWIKLSKLTYKSDLNKKLKISVIFVLCIMFLTSISIFVDMPFIWKLTSNIKYIILFLLIIVGVSILFVFTNKVKITNTVEIILYWFLGLIVFMFFISLNFLPFKVPMFYDRYLMVLAIAFILLLGIMVDTFIKRKYYRYITPVIFIVLFFLTTNPNISNKRNVKEMMEIVKKLKETNTIVYFCPSWFDLNFVYYYNFEWFKNYDNQPIKRKLHKYMSADNIYPIDNKNQIDTIKLKEFNTIIYIDAGAGFSFPKNGICEKLNGISISNQKYEFYEMFKVYEYQLK